MKEALDAFVESTQQVPDRLVRVKLYKGSVEVVGRESPYSLYNEGLATYAKGDEFDHTSAKGFIYVWGLPLKTVAAAHKAKMKVVEHEPREGRYQEGPQTPQEGHLRRLACQILSTHYLVIERRVGDVRAMNPLKVS